MAKNSAIGPSTSAGKNVRRSDHQDGAEPKDPELQAYPCAACRRVGGTVGFAANDPATAIMKMIGG